MVVGMGKDIIEEREIVAPDITADSALNECVVPHDSLLYGELQNAADRLGVSVGSYAYRSVRRILEKVSGGMNLDEACIRAGIKPEEFKVMAESDAGLRDMLYGIRHKFDMKVMGSVMRDLENEKGNGKLALDILGRQSTSFAPPKQSVEVSKTIDIRGSRVIDAEG